MCFFSLVRLLTSAPRGSGVIYSSAVLSSHFPSLPPSIHPSVSVLFGNLSFLFLVRVQELSRNYLGSWSEKQWVLNTLSHVCKQLHCIRVPAQRPAADRADRTLLRSELITLHGNGAEQTTMRWEIAPALRAASVRFCCAHHGGH